MDIMSLKKITGYAFCDAAYDFAAESAEEIVCNYCNVDQVPDGLVNTTMRIAADLLRKGQYGSGDVPTTVSSIKVGDTTTSFTPLSDSETVEVIANYTKTLNRYRRVMFA